jgi:hypothetical protein
MPASAELQNFLRQNRAAWLLAWKASDDYLLARLGLTLGLWSGFEMATQATEKLLKSYVLFKDVGLGGSEENVLRAVSAISRMRGRKHELGHDVEAVLDLATASGLPCSAGLQVRLARINSYYALRYPGGAGPISFSTAEIQDIDEAVFELWDAFQSINVDYFYTSGLMMPVYGLLLSDHVGRPEATTSHYFGIMTNLNQPFEKRREDIEQGIRERLECWYPRS